MESIADLNSINDLLDSIVKTNKQMLDKSTFQVRSKNQEIPKELVESIRKELSNQNFITLDEDNSMGDIPRQITKK